MSDHWTEYGEIPEDKVIEKAKTLMITTNFVLEYLIPDSLKTRRCLKKPLDSLLKAIQEYEKNRYKKGNTMKDFIPTNIDKTFIKQIFTKLVIGGTWGYSNLPLVFQKTDDKTLSLVAAWPELAPEGVINREIKKTRIVLKACGLKFTDLRNGPNPNPIPEKKA